MLRVRNPSLDPQKKKEHPFIDVPCGKCAECLSQRRRQWVLRLKLEYQYCTSCFAVTLTYDDEHLAENASLCKRHVQLFMKRLRHYNIGEKPIKYFIVGEYGDKLGRPHYHAIFFNLVCEDIKKAFDNCWTYGFYKFGDNKGPAFAYTAKYYIKQFDAEYYADLMLSKPFTLVSKGIGSSYLTDENIRFHEDNDYCIISTFDGQNAFMPKYLRNKIWTNPLNQKNVVQQNFTYLVKKGIINLSDAPNRALALNNRFDSIQRKLHHK